MSNRMSLKEYKELVKEKSKNIPLNIREQTLLQRSTMGKTKSSAVRRPNDGMAFEGIIEDTNNYYKNNNMAYIRKIPTPVKVTKTKGGKIVSAFYESKSSLDFNGIIKEGKHIDFDTKDTQIKTRFPFGNVLGHQFEYMKEIDKYGGITFLLVRFRLHKEVYVLRYLDIQEYLSDNIGKKSIPYNYFKTKLIKNKVKEKFVDGFYIYDYLQIIKELYNL